MSISLKDNIVSEPVGLIIDTDIGNDIDDALALAIAYNLEDEGECKLLGVAVNKDNKYSPMFVDILNTFYGKGNIDIGVVENGKTPEDGNFVRQVSTDTVDGEYRYARTYEKYDTDAVSMYRKLLSESPDGSVKIVSIGFMTNLARLLVSAADEYSELNGSQLVAKKVCVLSAMAGNFSQEALSSGDTKFAEYNVKNDIKSAQFVCDNWLSPIVFSGLEVGNEILYPAVAIYEDYDWAKQHPIVDAYKLYLDMPYDRPTWDLTSVLCVADDRKNLFGLSERGKVSVTDEGVVAFEAKHDGQHRYLIFNPQKRQLLQDIMRRMCAYQPKVLNKINSATQTPK